MSNDKSTTSNHPGAKLDAQAPASKPFNKANYLEEQISKLSPDGQKNCRHIQKLAERNREGLKIYQAEHRDQRIQEEKTKGIERYLKDQALRPESARTDPAQDLQVIQQQAERKVDQGNEWALQSRDRAVYGLLKEEISFDKEQAAQQSQQHGQEQQPEHDQER